MTLIAGKIDRDLTGKERVRILSRLQFPTRMPLDMAMPVAHRPSGIGLFVIWNSEM